MARSRLGLVAASIVVLVASAAAVHARRHAHATAGGTPGDFTYYVLSLSWSPQYCADVTDDGDPQCSHGRRFGFVAHGLWPQRENGWPELCGGGKLKRSLVDSMLDIMPSPQLIRHEWEKHGTCSGLPASEHFRGVREAFGSIRVPPAYVGPLAVVRTTPATFRRVLLDANPGLAGDGIAVLCSGRFLQEVRVCLDKDLAPRRCAPDVRDHCPGPDLLLRPVR